MSPAEPPNSTSLPLPPSRVEATLEARIVSLPLPPTAFSTTVSKAMAMLLARPPALEKEPGVRSTVAFCEKPERSSVLLVPWLQIVTMAGGLMLKS